MPRQLHASSSSAIIERDSSIRSVARAANKLRTVRSCRDIAAMVPETYRLLVYTRDSPGYDSRKRPPDLGGLGIKIPQ